MAKIIHDAANLELINGVKFVDGVSEDVSDEVAAAFLEIPGFTAAEGSAAPAPQPTATKTAKAEKADKKKAEAPAPAGGEPTKSDPEGDDDTTF